MDESGQQALLAQLRDAQAPMAPGWWPPAPGWWLLALALLCGGGLLFWWLRKRRQPHWKKSALREHQRLMARSTDFSPPDIKVIAQASVLMRRVALAVLPRNQVASLTDLQWLEVLDRLGNTRQFSDGVGRLLTRHPYMPPGSVSSEETTSLLGLMADTINNADSVSKSPNKPTREEPDHVRL